jgi:predicted extracellular nuclease
VTQLVATEGVVVGDYEGASPALRGFYLQAASGDGDEATSDAVFVFNGTNDSVALGQTVRVVGTVAEFQGQTQVGHAHVAERL